MAGDRRREQHAQRIGDRWQGTGGSRMDAQRIGGRWWGQEAVQDAQSIGGQVAGVRRQ